MTLPNNADLIARHLAFWHRNEVEHPLLGVYLGSYLSEDIYKVAKDGELLQPAQLEAERFFDSLSDQLAQLDGLDQDLIIPAQPISSVPWLEGMFGCPVRVSNHAVWAETLLESGDSLEAFYPPWDETWENAALQFVRTLVDHFGPLVPVAGPFLRGPADVLAALLGANRLAIELIDHPAQVQRLAQLCAQRWVEVSHRILAEIPPWKDGYVHGARWIYAPEPCSYASEDITQLFSPRSYREIFLPYNRWMAEQVPYGFWHRHAPSQHHLEALTCLPATWAIEVTIDPSGPRPQQIWPVLHRLQEAGKCLILFGLNDPEEVRFLASTLSGRGLCLTVQANDLESAASLLQAAREGDWAGQPER
jgi:hypothetical protein